VIRHRDALRVSLAGKLGDRADISVAVIHERAKQPATARRSEVVNNCAADDNCGGGRPALVRSRSRASTPSEG
jgi:hypothetical protein